MCRGSSLSCPRLTQRLMVSGVGLDAGGWEGSDGKVKLRNFPKMGPLKVNSAFKLKHFTV